MASVNEVSRRLLPERILAPGLRASERCVVQICVFDMSGSWAYLAAASTEDFPEARIAPAAQGSRAQERWDRLVAPAFLNRKLRRGRAAWQKACGSQP